MPESRATVLTHDEMARIERLAAEVGALFDREKLPPELATAVLLDLWARTAARVANGNEDARKELVAAGAELLDGLTKDYARGADA